MKAFHRFSRAAALLLALALLISVPALSSCSAKRVVSDLRVLSAALEEHGYHCSLYENEHTLLSDIEQDMRLEMSDPPKGRLHGFLFAVDPLGNTALEIFCFEKARDARRLYDYFEGKEQFVPGESDVRRSGKVVYMGRLDALEIVENASEKGADK